MIHSTPLALLRIIFGLTLLYWIYLSWPLIDYIYNPPGFRFQTLPVDIYSPLPSWSIRAAFYLLIASSCTLTLGLFYRVSAILTFLSFSFIFFGNSTFSLNNHYYLSLLLSFLLIFLSANAKFSLDNKLFPTTRKEYLPAWQLYILRFQVGVVYFFGGVRKISSDWLEGCPFGVWLQIRFPQGSVLDQIFSLYGMGRFMSFAGMIFDLCIVPLLIYKRTRIAACVMAVAFHILNVLLFTDIDYFPYFMIGATILFFDWRSPLSVTSLSLPKPYIALLSTYVLAQVLIPLRIYLVDGNVHWTKQSERFAWNMKLYDTRTELKISVKDSANNKSSIQIDPCEDLTSVQYKTMASYPHLLLQYVHFLEERYKKQIKEPIIDVQLNNSLNGRAIQTMIDSSLSSTTYYSHFHKLDWIQPLKKVLHCQYQQEPEIFVHHCNKQ